MSTAISATATVVTVDTSSAAKTLVLPSAASRLGRIITVKDLTGGAATKNITINPYADGGTAGTTQAVDLIEGLPRITGAVNPLIVNVNYGAVTLLSVSVGTAVATNTGNNTTGYAWRIISSTYLNSTSAAFSNLLITSSLTVSTNAFFVLQGGSYLNIQGSSFISTSGDIYVGTAIRISASANLAVLPNLSANNISVAQLYGASLTGQNLSTSYMSVGQAFIANLVTANEFITTSFSTVLMSVGQASLGSTTIGFLTVTGAMSTLSSVGVAGQLSVTGATTLNSTLTVVGAMSTLSTLVVGGQLYVAGPAIFNSNIITSNISTNNISSGTAYSAYFAGVSHSTIFLSAGQSFIGILTTANTSTNSISSGNITVGNTMTAFIASTQQNIASSFFGNLADAQTVVVQSI